MFNEHVVSKRSIPTLDIHDSEWIIAQYKCVWHLVFIVSDSSAFMQRAASVLSVSRGDLTVVLGPQCCWVCGESERKRFKHKDRAAYIMWTVLQVLDLSYSISNVLQILNFSWEWSTLKRYWHARSRYNSQPAYQLRNLRSLQAESM